MAKKRPTLNLEELRNSKLVIFKKLQRSPLITVSNNRILRELKICLTFVIPTPTTKTLRADFMIDGFTSWAILILLFFAQNVINLWHCTCPLNKYLKFLNEIRFKFPAIKVCTYLCKYLKKSTLFYRWTYVVHTIIMTLEM